MTELPKPQQSSAERMALDFAPLVLFFAALLLKGIFVATGVFMAAITVVVAISLIRYRRVSPMLAITAVIVLALGGLTLYLHDKTFIKIKPTIAYSVFAVILAGGALTGRNFIKALIDQTFHLSDAHWRILTIRWAIFFALMAILNEIVWRNFSDQFWAGFKLFGAIPLTFLFAMSQTPFLLKHHIEDKTDA